MTAVIDVVFEDSLWVDNLSNLVKSTNTVGIHLYNFTHFIKSFKKNNKRIFYQNSNTVSLVNAITVANFLPNIATKATKTTAFSTCAKNPRIVVWREGQPVKLCSTQIYISSDKEDAVKIYYTKVLPYIKSRYQKYTNVLDCSNQCLTKQPISNSNLLYARKSIAVFDLDDTLIDEKNKPKKGALKLIEAIKDRFDILVLWSHGGRIHVGEQLRKNEWSDTFDVALFNTDIDSLNCKNLLYLYNVLPENVIFSKAILLDDRIDNWSPEYDDMFLIDPKSSLHSVTREIEKKASMSNSYECVAFVTVRLSGLYNNGAL
uniref:Uncharacterized protein n=1 Tax=Tetranychus urticae TaxID=32264 RepID=T1K351_TETUR